MFTVLLNHKGKPVTVATLRVFGDVLAEMPLVATRECARRQVQPPLVLSLGWLWHR